MSDNFRSCGDSLSVRRIDSQLKALIVEATCASGDKNREIAQGHLQTYLAEHSSVRPVAAAFFDQLFDEHKQTAGLGLQETFSTLFTPDNKESVNRRLLANMVFVLATASDERLYEKTSANIDRALQLRPDLKTVVEDEKKRFPARAFAVRDAERRAPIYAAISSL